MTAEGGTPHDILPHSYPFVLIDKIIEIESGKRIVCLKNVTLNEEFFLGHFRDNPVVPGVLIIEAMAQASGLIVGAGSGVAVAAFLAGVRDARFRKLVVPGDQLIVKSALVKDFMPLYVFEAAAYVRDAIVAEAEITLTLQNSD